MRLNSSALLASLVFGMAVVAGGCSHNKEAACTDVKPGTVTTANKVCVMVNADPVNPSVTPVEWKGQKYGLCCNGCRPKWNALTDAQKDAAVAKALAASK
jgi:hypothetical protein